MRFGVACNGWLATAHGSLQPEAEHTEPSSVPVRSIVLSDCLFSCLTHSVAFMLQGFQLLVDLCLLSSQLPFHRAKVLIPMQLFELLPSIIELMLQRLKEDLISPTWSSSIPSMNALQLSLSFSVLSLMLLGTLTCPHNKLLSSCKVLLESSDFLLLVVQPSCLALLPTLVFPGVPAFLEVAAALSTVWWNLFHSSADSESSRGPSPLGC